MTIQHPSLPTEILSNIFDNKIERNNVSFETKKRKIFTGFFRSPLSPLPTF